MLPFGIGFGEVVLILIVVLLVVGPDKLPTIAKTIGKGVRAARRAGNELRDAVQAEEIRRDVAESVRKWSSIDPIEDIELDEEGTYATADGTSDGTPDTAEAELQAQVANAPLTLSRSPLLDKRVDEILDPPDPSPEGPDSGTGSGDPEGPDELS